MQLITICTICTYLYMFVSYFFPCRVMHLVALYVTGNDDYSRMLRRALMRYLNLSLILVLRSISSAVKRRFPTLDHVVDSGKSLPHAGKRKNRHVVVAAILNKKNKKNLFNVCVCVTARRLHDFAGARIVRVGAE